MTFALTPEDSVREDSLVGDPIDRSTHGAFDGKANCRSTFFRSAARRPCCEQRQRHADRAIDRTNGECPAGSPGLQRIGGDAGIKATITVRTGTIDATTTTNGESAAATNIAMMAITVHVIGATTVVGGAAGRMTTSNEPPSAANAKASYQNVIQRL